MAKKNKVCFGCDGDGYVSNIGDFNGADVDEWFGDDFDARGDFISEYMRPGGAYDKRCEVCDGNKVIPTFEYDEKLREFKEREQWRAEMYAEQRMGC